MEYQTPQEKFWASDFGDEYIKRNDLTEKSIALYLAKWGRIIPHLPVTPSSILEFGANIGLNLRALRLLFPQARLSGVEINAEAVETLKNWGQAEVYNESILNFSAEHQFDLVFTSGVLIHIAPDKLPDIYKKMYDFSSRYIIVSEYYNPNPLEVNYRGHSEKLFKRDFAGEIMDLYPDLTLCGYGFLYRRDPLFAFDDISWFVMKKEPGL
ncbi:methyltransferase domain-containing protein [Deltaproteobacteria bacterium OttesenSCG-928-M10]|nr:methyltransferase domain-containing protein [Deltaproteobacteria bacterium OttesenSCG-928-M10]